MSISNLPIQLPNEVGLHLKIEGCADYLSSYRCLPTLDKELESYFVKQTLLPALRNDAKSNWLCLKKNQFSAFKNKISNLYKEKLSSLKKRQSYSTDFRLENDAFPEVENRHRVEEHIPATSTIVEIAGQLVEKQCLFNCSRCLDERIYWQE